MRNHSVTVFGLGLVLGACGAADSSEVQELTSGERPLTAPVAAVTELASQDAGSPSWLEPVSVDVGTGTTREQVLLALQPYNLPDWAHARARRHGLTHTLALAHHLNPFYQSGDFDGDGHLDVAVLVTRRATGEVGILLLHGGREQRVLFGAGEDFGNGGINFDWMTYWKVQPRRESGTRGDALEVIKAESASGLIYWDGSTYRWRQLGD